MPHSVYDQPETEAVHAQFDKMLDALADKLPAVAEHLDGAAPTSRPLPSSPKELLAPDLSNNPVRHEALSFRREVRVLPRWAVAAA